ncbi:MAG: TIM barrel protein, partial [Chloroflexi bacterium]|nr:TIM barrel protein [Chloroflexota bacterium]
MRIGAHVSTAGGVDKGIDRAVEIGAECVQIFASSPRGWAFKPIPEDRARAFREKSAETGVAPAFIHGSYLVNLGGTPDLVKKSIQSLVQNMEAASQLGAKGVIFHCGSHKGVGFDG